MIATLTLAAVLAFPPGAETIRISEETWPERQAVAKIERGERVWWWSKECAPQLLTVQEADVVCTATVPLRVSVVDRASGKHVAGARVIWGTDAMLVHVPDAMLPSASTDAEGSALLHVPAGAVRVRVDGPRVASWWEAATASTAALRLATVPAAPMSIEVTPGSRAVVQLELPVSEVRSWAVARDGRVLLPAIPPVPVTLAAWSEASVPVVMDVDAARMPRTLELPRGTSIAGRVVDARRRPIEGAAIEAIFGIGKLPRGLRRTVRSSPSGAFVVRGIPAGPMRLQVSKPELVTIVRAVQPEADTDLGNITLRSARNASVRVVDSDGQPVAEAAVRIADGPSASTDRAGLARLEGVPADEDVAVHVSARGFRAADADLAADTKSPLVIELSRGVRVIGTVMSAEHGGSAGAGDVLVINNGAQRVIAFDDSGAIDIGGLDEGTLSLEVRAPSLAPLSIPKRDVAADETWDLGTLRLDAGNIVTGRVFNEDGAALAGARVRALRPHARGPEVAAVMNDWIVAASGEDGAFRVSGLAAGSHLLLVDAAGFAPRMLTVEVNADPLDVRLDRARGLVVDCAPVARCGSEARLLYAGALHPWATTSAAMQDGTARIATAATGTALLRLVHNGSVIHERTVQIGATPETRVQIRLAAATLQGTVTSAGRARRDGGVVDLRAKLAPAAGVPVYLERRTSDGLVTGGGWVGDMPSMHSTTVDPAGRFVFEDLEPGSYEATYRSEGRPSKSVSLVVQPGTSRVTIEVPPGELRGRVLQEDGRAAGFMTVRVLDAAGSELLVQSDQFGRFETIGVATGPAVVTAETERSAASTRVDVDIAQAAVVEMVLRPKPGAGNDEQRESRPSP